MDWVNQMQPGALKGVNQSTAIAGPLQPPAPVAPTTNGLNGALPGLTGMASTLATPTANNDVAKEQQKNQLLQQGGSTIGNMLLPGIGGVLGGLAGGLLGGDDAIEKAKREEEARQRAQQLSNQEKEANDMMLKNMPLAPRRM